MSKRHIRPNWSIIREDSDDLQRQADFLLTESNEKRCPVELRDGSQCTKDRGTDHEHVYDERDLP